jgi:hypothetical protein
VRPHSRRPGGCEENFSGRKGKGFEAQHADEEGKGTVFFAGPPWGQATRLDTCTLCEGECDVLSLIAKQKGKTKEGVDFKRIVWYGKRTKIPKNFYCNSGDVRPQARARLARHCMR